MRINNECNPQQRTETVCIKVPKIYDWVTRQADVPVMSLPQKKHNGRGSLQDIFGDNCAQVPISDADVARFGVIECFLSDEFGRPLDPLADGSIICTEITQQGGRQDVDIHVPGLPQPVTLQKVKVLKKGFVTVTLTVPPRCKKDGSTSTTIVCCETIPFQVVEKFFLCAPEGTFLQCHITDFECDAQLLFFPDHSDPECGEFQLDVSINMCQDIQMEAIVKLEVRGEFCQPRQDVAFECPPRQFPPQCPTVFPN